MIDKFVKISMGRTDLMVSPMGVGTNRWGIQRIADPGLADTFSAALEAGLTLFDTAEIYNFGGSEKTLGAFLPGGDPQIIVTSKFLPLPWRLDKTSLVKALRASLERLKLDSLDLYLIHMQWPPVPVNIWMDALADANQAGLIRNVGVSNYDAIHLEKASAALGKLDIPLACNQVEYNLLNRNVERNGVQAICQKLGITLVAYRPFAGGFLTGKYLPENPHKGLRRWMYPVGNYAKIAPLLQTMKNIGANHGGRSPSQVALNWLRYKGAMPIPGATKVSHIQENAGALDWELSADEVALLDLSS